MISRSLTKVLIQFPEIDIGDLFPPVGVLRNHGCNEVSGTVLALIVSIHVLLGVSYSVYLFFFTARSMDYNSDLSSLQKFALGYEILNSFPSFYLPLRVASVLFSLPWCIAFGW